MMLKNSYKSITICLISVALVIFCALIRLSGPLLNLKSTNDYIFINNCDEIHFENLIFKADNNQITENHGYPPTFPNTLLILHKYLKPYLDNNFAYNSIVRTRTFIPRLVSFLSNTLTVLLVFILSFYIFNSLTAAIFAGIFYALSPLAIINSFYGTADSLNLFMFWFSVCLFYFGIHKKNFKLYIIACVVSGIALATKFSLSLLLVFAHSALIFWKAETTKSTRKKKACLLVLILSLLLGIFLAFGKQSSYQWLFSVYNVIIDDNIAVKDHNYILNPVFYLIQLIVGVGAACYLLVIYFIRLSWKNKLGFFDKKSNHILISAFLSHLILISSLAIPASRHSLPLLPFFCIIAGCSLTVIIRQFRESPVIKYLFILIIIAYQSGSAFSIIRPYVLVNNKAELVSWLSNNYKTPIKVNFYHGHLSETNKYHLVSLWDNPDLYIFNPEYKSRYFASTLNPWGVPDCNVELYHGNVNQCLLTKEIVENSEKYELMEYISPTAIIPEQILFNYIWEAYDIFEQKFYIYRKRQT